MHTCGKNIVQPDSELVEIITDDAMGLPHQRCIRERQY